MSAPLTLPIARATDSNVDALSGAKLYCYLTGTTTPASVYTTEARDTAHANPVVADSGGLFAPIYVDPAVTYRFVLKTAGDATIIDMDPVSSVDADDLSFLQTGTGAVSRSIQSKLSDRVSVLDFIPVAQHAAIIAGTSTDDHGAYIQLAFNTGKAVYFPGSAASTARYNTSQEIDMNSSPALGDGSECSRIVAIAAIRSIFKLEGRVKIDGLLVDGNSADGNLSNAGVYCENSNGAIITNSRITAHKLDGVHFPASGNNSSTTIVSNQIDGNGHTYETGTAETTASGTVATITGAADLTTLAIRPNYDLIQIGSEKARTITGVGTNTITVSGSDPFNTTVSGSTYKILMGHGVLITHHTDNNLVKIENNSIQGNAASGWRDGSLYGCQSKGNALEGNDGYGWIIGTYTVASPTGGREQASYTEDGGSGAGLIEAGSNLIISPGPTQNDLNGIRIPSFSTITSLRIDYAGEVIGNKIASYTNTTTINMEQGQTANVTMSGAGSDMTINLPAVTAGTNSAAIYSNLDQITVVDLLSIGGKTATFKTTDGSTINGVAGATGIVLYGNYRRAVARYTGSTGWQLTVSGLNEISGSKTFDPGSIAAAGTETTTVTVTGAALGDYASASFSLSQAGLNLTAYVSAADTVTCVFSNPTAGAVDLGSGTLRARVRKA